MGLCQSLSPLYCMFILFSLLSLGFLSKNFFADKTTRTHFVAYDANELCLTPNPSCNFSTVHL